MHSCSHKRMEAGRRRQNMVTVRPSQFSIFSSKANCETGPRPKISHRATRKRILESARQLRTRRRHRPHRHRPHRRCPHRHRSDRHLPSLMLPKGQQSTVKKRESKVCINAILKYTAYAACRGLTNVRRNAQKMPSIVMKKRSTIVTATNVYEMSSIVTNPYPRNVQKKRWTVSRNFNIAKKANTCSYDFPRTAV